MIIEIYRIKGDIKGLLLLSESSRDLDIFSIDDDNRN